MAQPESIQAIVIRTDIISCGLATFLLDCNLQVLWSYKNFYRTSHPARLWSLMQGQWSLKLERWSMRLGCRVRSSRLPVSPRLIDIKSDWKLIYSLGPAVLKILISPTIFAYKLYKICPVEMFVFDELIERKIGCFLARTNKKSSFIA